MFKNNPFSPRFTSFLEKTYLICKKKTLCFSQLTIAAFHLTRYPVQKQSATMDRTKQRIVDRDQSSGTGEKETNNTRRTRNRKNRNKKKRTEALRAEVVR